MKEQLITKSLKLSNDILFECLIELINGGKQVKMNISGSSMQPFLYDGDTIVLQSVKLEDIKLGDVVLGKYNSAYVLHRVINKKKDCIYIAGDNNISQIEIIYIQDICALANTLIKYTGDVNLRSSINRYKGLVWYYLRPFRRVCLKLFKRK